MHVSTVTEHGSESVCIIGRCPVVWLSDIGIHMIHTDEQY